MSRGSRRPVARVLALCAAGLVVAPRVHAQVAGPAAPVATRVPAPPGPRWEIEGYGVLALARLSPLGSSALPPPGPALTTSSPLFPTRQTPSWFFGDGARLLNDVSTEFNLPARIAPLDATLRSLGLGAARAGGGLRLRRNLTPRLSAEFSLELGRRSGDLPADLTSAGEAARSSFASTFAALLATGPFTGVVVSATNAMTRGSGIETSATAALNVHFRRRGAFVPYVTLGGGVTAGTGHPPSMTLDGDYRFSVLGDVPIHEHDHLTIASARPSRLAPVGVIGGGVRRDISDRWGWRVDGRVLLGPGSRLLMDATPVVSGGIPAGVVESFTNPNLQFSNDPSTGRRSTLGGSPLASFVAFDEGLRLRVVLTAGVFRRF